LPPVPPKVLAVEADPDALRLLVSALSLEGFEVTPAEDFEAAAGHLSSLAFDAVIAAHRLGPHNGLHLLLRARLVSPNVIAIVVSHETDPYLPSEATALGSLAVTAPLHDPSAALDALRGAMNSVHYFST
jgi:DNA-binding response OmpR family regulator